MDVVYSAARNTGISMKALKTGLIICLVVVTALFAAGQVYTRVVADNSRPVITLDSDYITISVEDGQPALLQGVSAWDDRDGDLSGEVIVSGVSKLINNNTAKVSYMVFDKAGNMGSATRYVRYSDYHRPRFMLTRPLVYNLGEAVALSGRLQAQDVIDGDITSSIRVLSSDIISSIEGVYSLSLQVTNSVGDTAQVTLPVTIRHEAEGESQLTLRRYLIYMEQGGSFDAKAYIDSVPAGAAGDVRIDNGIDANTPGSYIVTYSCTVGGRTSTAILTVVVE